MSERLEARLRDAAAKCTRPKYRAALTKAADKIHAALGVMATHQDNDSMILLNGAWVNGVRVLNGTPPEASPLPPLAEVQRLAA